MIYDTCAKYVMLLFSEPIRVLYLCCLSSLLSVSVSVCRPCMCLCVRAYLHPFEERPRRQYVVPSFGMFGAVFLCPVGLTRPGQTDHKDDLEPQLGVINT